MNTSNMFVFMISQNSANHNLLDGGAGGFGCYVVLIYVRWSSH